MHLTLHHTVPTAVTPSPNVLRIAAMFGLGLDDTPDRTIINPFQLHLQPRQCILITGPSGSGKSTILKCIAEAIRHQPHRARLLRFDDLPPLPDAPLVDCFHPLPLNDTLALLARAGLSDAFIMLRRPAQLSEGQRYRLKLAQTIALARQPAPQPLTVVLADEFGATLDRITAAIIARNVRKWTQRQPNLCFIAATTHEDLHPHLTPDLHIQKHLGPSVVASANHTPQRPMTNDK